MGVELFGVDLSWKQISVIAATVIVPIPLTYILYSGLSKSVKRVVCRRPAYGKMRIAYKLKKGEYCARGGNNDFHEARAVHPGLTTLGIYYDDPDQVKGGDQRYVVAVILAEGDETVDSNVENKFQENGYSFFTLPEVAAAVQTSFPITTNISYGLGSVKVYKQFDSFIKENGLRWNPAIEIYDGETIIYMVPQSDGEKFCVPEVSFVPKEKIN